MTQFIFVDKHAAEGRSDSAGGGVPAVRVVSPERGASDGTITDARHAVVNAHNAVAGHQTQNAASSPGYFPDVTAHQVGAVHIHEPVAER